MFEVGKRGFLCHGGRRYPVEVLHVAEDTVLVSHPETCPIARGMGVDLEFPEPHGAACYHAHVIVVPDKPEDGVVLQRAASVTRIERRRSWRVPLDAKSLILKEGVPRARGITRDVSAEGALVETDAPLEINELIELHMQVPGEPTVRAVARVVRAKASHAGPEGEQLFGVWFLHMPAASRRSLTYYIWKRLRTHRPNHAKELFRGGGRRGLMRAQAKKPPAHVVSPPRGETAE